jgi:hypothetical protein
MTLPEMAQADQTAGQRVEPGTGLPDNETAAWAWLDGMVSGICDEEPSDIAYSADQMVTAFMAGRRATRERDGGAADIITEALGALELLQSFGCPVCNGDCGSANPPVTTCPMQVARAVITKARGGAA